MIERHRRRLERAFGAIVLAVGAPALAQGCGQDGTTPGGAGAPPDASNEQDAGADVRCTLAMTVIDAGADVEENCRYLFNCGLPPNIVAVGCTLALADSNGQPIEGGMPPCQLLEGQGCRGGAYDDAADGGAAFECAPCLGPVGRRTVGLRPLVPRAGSPLAVFFARAAHDEAAAITAFERMRDELETHGAPRALVRAAERAVRDERRHARMMERWAASFGGVVRWPRIDRPRPRGFGAMVRENAVEGCVHETFAALLATWQAAHARDRRLAATFAQLAADETRHAALAWSFAAWAEPRLSPRARASLRRARLRALDELRHAAGFEPSDVFVRDVGLPSAAAARALVDGFARELGRPA